MQSKTAFTLTFQFSISLWRSQSRTLQYIVFGLIRERYSYPHYIFLWFIKLWAWTSFILRSLRSWGSLLVLFWFFLFFLFWLWVWAHWGVMRMTLLMVKCNRCRCTVGCMRAIYLIFSEQQRLLANTKENSWCLPNPKTSVFNKHWWPAPFSASGSSWSQWDFRP